MFEGEHHASVSGGRDPVCGMQLSSQTAIRFTYGHAIFMFCGSDCLEHFRQHPETYLLR